MGRLICPDIIVIADEQAVTISREHTIVGYYGCSGGMIGTFHEAISNGPGPNHAQASLEVKVIGICKSD